MTQLAMECNTYHKRGLGMDVKKQLQQHCWVNENINHLEEQLLEMETDIQRMTQRFNDMPKSEGQHDKFTDKIAEMIDIKKEINDELLRKWELRKKVEGMIETLDEREQRLVRYRYIECLTWEKCAVKMNYEWRHLHNIHKKILIQLKNNSL